MHQKINHTFNSYYLEMFDIPFALAYLNKSSREVLLSKLEAKERIRKLKILLAQRRFIIHYDFTMDDEWTEDDYCEALSAIERGEKEYKGFDLRKIHLK